MKLTVPWLAYAVCAADDDVPAATIRSVCNCTVILAIIAVEVSALQTMVSLIADILTM